MPREANRFHLKSSARIPRLSLQGGSAVSFHVVDRFVYRRACGNLRLWSGADTHGPNERVETAPGHLDGSASAQESPSLSYGEWSTFQLLFPEMLVEPFGGGFACPLEGRDMGVEVVTGVHRERLGLQGAL